MTPRAEARLYGRAIRRFNTSPEKLEEIIEVLYGFATDESLKPNLRIDAAKSLIAAEALNQKDEHKLLTMLAPNAAIEQGGNRFLE
jgi:uncharacterized protein (UPF0147 family)